MRLHCERLEERLAFSVDALLAPPLEEITLPNIEIETAGEEAGPTIGDYVTTDSFDLTDESGSTTWLMAPVSNETCWESEPLSTEVPLGADPVDETDPALWPEPDYRKDLGSWNDYWEDDQIVWYMPWFGDEDEWGINYRGAVETETPLWMTTVFSDEAFADWQVNEPVLFLAASAPPVERAMLTPPLSLGAATSSYPMQSFPAASDTPVTWWALPPEAATPPFY
ncbi:MAG: hypothetical protein NZ703_13795, partial [Gemmataceae bacterium]|nr:hypothetical protein [Gemmataceae bacterium]